MPDGSDRTGTQSPEEERSKKAFLPHFNIVKPSLNKERNSNTFAYRLSELVFGSLLASYILGFLGFIVTYVQPLHVPKPGESVIWLTFTAFIRLSSFVDVVVLLQYLNNSLLFAIYTALVYFHYHQSLLYISTDLQRASSDFLIAVSIGIFFGLSMLMPLMVIFFVGCMIVMVLNKKRRLLIPYWSHFAVEAGLVRSSDPQYAPALEERCREIRRVLKTTPTPDKPNPVLVSWSKVGSGAACIGGILMICVSVILLVLTNLVDVTGQYLQAQITNGVVPSINLAATVAITVVLYRALRAANWTMPTSEHGGGEQLDLDLDAALRSLKGG